MYLMRVSAVWWLLSLHALSQAAVVPPLAAGPGHQKRDCQGNNCIRALRSTIEGVRRGSADCTSYLLTTLIPPTTTITATATAFGTASVETDITVTSTIYTTPVETIGVVSTNVVDATSTESDHTVEVVTVEETATLIVHSTSTQTQLTTVTTVAFTGDVQTRDATSTHTNTATALATQTNKVTIQARDVTPTTTTIIPSNIPAYATPCDGKIEFSSACSCFGVTASTITLPSPSVTITVPYTLTTATDIKTVFITVPSTSVSTATTYTTDSTQTVSTTVATATLTIVDSTSSTSKTVSTQTNTVVQSTQTLVVPASTSTRTSTTTTQTVFTTITTQQVTQTLATSTTIVTQTTLTSCAGSTPTFALQVANSNTAFNGRYLGEYQGNTGVTDVFSAHADEATLATAVHFHLVGTDLYDSLGRVMSGSNDGVPRYMQFFTIADRNANGNVNYPCTISNGLLACSNSGRNTWYVCPNVKDFIDLAPPGKPAFSWCVQSAVSLAVVPLCKF